MMVGEKTSNDPHITPLPNHLPPAGGLERAFFLLGEKFPGRAGGLVRRLGRPWDYARRWYGADDFHYPGTRFLLDSLQPDVLIHAHNLHGGYFDLRLLPELCRPRPVHLTLHDAWLATGHCAYFLDCSRWQSGCGSCPHLDTPPAVRMDATAWNWKQKRDILAQCRLAVACPSRWMLDIARQSILAPALLASRVIPNGVDLDCFQPAPSEHARSQLGIPPERRVVLMAANRMRSNPYKGYPTLHRAAEILSTALPEEEMLFLCLGDRAPSEQVGASELRFLAVENPLKMALCYQAADLYLHAATADNFPNTVLEALACGIPVVACSAGGVPEQVEDGVTGFLTPPGDPQSMAQAALRLLNDDSLRASFGVRAAEQARLRFDSRRMARDYLDFYREACP